MNNFLDNNDKNDVAYNKLSLCPYERPMLEVLEIEMEGSFLNANSSTNFQDRVVIDDEELADDYD